MPKILTTEQIRTCDAETIRIQNIKSIDLMERAAYECANWISKRLNRSYTFHIFCGPGNNGGDGLAISRMLNESGYSCKTYITDSENRAHDCQINLDRLISSHPESVLFLDDHTLPKITPGQNIFIEALFGSGLNRPIQGPLKRIVEFLNHQHGLRIAIDIPGGLHADMAPTPGSTIFKADHTLSFQLVKRSFLHPESFQYTGEVHLLDIQLDRSFIDSVQTSYHYLDTDTVKKMYMPRKPFDHKGMFGNVLIVAGQYGMMGAAILANRASMKSGAGKTTALIPACGLGTLQTASPETTCITAGSDYLCDVSHDRPSRTLDLSDYNSIAVGPGIGTHPETARFISRIIEEATDPLILDADALNILSGHKGWLKKLPSHSIITPHPGEFRHMFAETSNSFDRLEVARQKAAELNIIIVLKGHHTTINLPDGTTWYNMTGNAGMATGGSGDVLTGIIAGLLAQGYSPEATAKIAVWIHGYAADLALRTESVESLIASDIITHLGASFKSITPY